MPLRPIERASKAIRKIGRANKTSRYRIPKNFKPLLVLAPASQRGKNKSKRATCIVCDGKMTRRIKGNVYCNDCDITIKYKVADEKQTWIDL